MIKKKSLIEQVIEVIIGKIKSGELKPGERLESQDEFAAKLGVSRSTVREAFSKLASMGIIEIMHGQGTYVKDVQDHSYADNILSAFNIIEKDSVLHILEVRKVIEKHAVLLAVEKASQEDIETLEKIVNKMEGLLDEPITYNQIDKEFHLQIAKISKNPVLHRLLSIVLNSFYEELSSSVIVPDSVRCSIVTITKIFNAIQNRDKEQAVANMQAHIDALLERTKIDLRNGDCLEI